MSRLLVHRTLCFHQGSPSAPKEGIVSFRKDGGQDAFIRNNGDFMFSAIQSIRTQTRDIDLFKIVGGTHWPFVSSKTSTLAAHGLRKSMFCCGFLVLELPITYLLSLIHI